MRDVSETHAKPQFSKPLNTRPVLKQKRSYKFARTQQQSQSIFRSKSEQIIADILIKNGIAFEYEKPLFIRETYDGRALLRIWYPDFYLKHHHILVEFLGRLDDPEYRRGVRKKQRAYEQQGLRVIVVANNEMWACRDRKWRVRQDFECGLMVRIALQLQK